MDKRGFFPLLRIRKIFRNERLAFDRAKTMNLKDREKLNSMKT